jgi:hypothetical protein
MRVSLSAVKYTNVVHVVRAVGGPFRMLNPLYEIRLNKVPIEDRNETGMINGRFVPTD